MSFQRSTFPRSTLCSSTVKNSAVQIILLVFGTVILTTAQDIAPALAGVKPPFVMAALLFAACHASLPFLMAIAAVAGLFLDALAGTPALCATCLLPLLSLGAHFIWRNMPAAPSATAGTGLMLGAAVASEVWLAVCGFAAAGTELIMRVCAAALLAAPIGAAVFTLSPWIIRHIGLEDSE